MKDDIVHEERVAMFLVNEYGEFSELMQVARLLDKSSGGHVKCVFLFARDDYGRLDDHRAQAVSAGFEALSLDREELEIRRWSRTGNARTMFGNLPDSRAVRPSFFSWFRAWLGTVISSALMTILAIPGAILAILALPVFFLMKIRNMFRIVFRLRDPFFFYRENRIRLAVEMVQIPGYMRRLRRWKTHAQSVLKEVKPDLVIMGQDYPGSYNAVIGKLARRRQINCVIVPFAMYTARELAESFFHYPNHVLPKGMTFGVLSRLFPNWVFVYKGRRLTRLPFAEMLAVELSRLSERTPWRPQTGPNHLFCQSQQALEYYRLLGKPEQQMRLTGSVWNDIVCENIARRAVDRPLRRRIVDLQYHLPRLRNRLVGAGMDVPAAHLEAVVRMPPQDALPVLEAIEFDLKARAVRLKKELASSDGTGAPFYVDTEIPTDQARKIVVVAWPANQYPARPMPGIPDYNTMSTRLISSLMLLTTSKKFDVWVSLHPTLYGVVDPKQFEDAGLRLVTWPLIDYVHCADVFVATVSSTLIWAVQCGIPSINFDGYAYGYPEFNQMGCKTVTSFGAFEQILQKLAAEPIDQVNRADDADAHAAYWGFPEGGSRERIVQGLQDLMRSRSWAALSRKR